MTNNSKYYQLILFLVLLIGIVLRFWRFWDIPFTYDELSALSRLQYDTLSDIISFGVTPDGHPAGVHVFLYYWIWLFGEQEFVVKLPFLMAGVASIWISYRIGQLWFNKTTGLLTAVYMSSLQLMIMYSQIARPYVSGLFLTLLMVLYWSKYFFHGNKIRHLVLFVIFASLSTYNHHFSLLFASIVGFSGLWFVTKKNRWLYILSGIAILLLYLPHLPIFFSQLNEGGIGSWLNKPGPYFLFEFLNWLFHFLPFVWIVFLGVCLFIMYAKGEMSLSTDSAKKRIVLSIWFILPLIIGYAYSVLIDPVLQYSMLIFSTPYLFILFFSGAKRISPQRLGLLIVLILLVNIGSLLWSREYYKVFYKQPYEQVVEHALKLESTQFTDDVFLIDDYIPFYNDYYFEKFGSAIPYYSTRNMGLNSAGFKKIIEGVDEKVVVTSGLKPDYFQIIKEKFPYLIGYEKGFTFEQYTFSKFLPDGEKELLNDTLALIDFVKKTGSWKINEIYIERDTAQGLSVFHVKPEVEYGPGINLPLNEITASRYLFIDIAVQVKSLDKQSKGAVVVVIKKGEETLSWKSVNFNDFELKEAVWTNIYLTLDLLTAIGREEDIESCEFHTFIWNPNSNDFLINQFQITTRPGNPLRYSLFYDITD